MNLREAYRMVIMHQLEQLEDSQRWVFTKGQKEGIVESLHTDDIYLVKFLEETEEHLETYGEEFGLF